MRILLSTWRKEVKIKLVVKSLLANVKNNDKEILRVVRLLYRALSPSHSNKWIELVACHAANSLRNIHFRFPYLSIHLFLSPLLVRINFDVIIRNPINFCIAKSFLLYCMQFGNHLNTLSFLKTQRIVSYAKTFSAKQFS